jgi:hypothetical protein
MSGYVPNNRHIRKAPEPEPYNGNFDQQARRPMQTPPASASQRMVGMRFIWDNGELLPPNIPYLLTADQGSPIRGGLDARGSFIQQLQANHYEAQLLADVDVDTAVASARSEMQAALDEILAAERAEAERLRKEQEGRNVVVNYFHAHFAFGKGFFLGAWGLVKSLKEMSDLVNPFNTAWNTLASAWTAKATPQEGWYVNFLNNYSAAQHEELVEALGFDPASITREQIAEAYETACFIYDDGPSKDILASFAVDYAKAQNIEEVAEFGGGAVFELVLAALLIIFTGGAGLAARGASSIRHAASLKRLGSALQRLSRTLKNAKIKLKGRGKGTGTGAQTVEVPRPKEIKAEKIELSQTTGEAGGSIKNKAKGQLEENKAKGAAYEEKVYADFADEMNESAQQVTVKTKKGTKTRLDMIGRNSEGNIVCVECKASETAPLTRNQKQGFPEIEENGAVIVGKGKPSFPGGTEIPPTRVEILRPTPKPIP